MPRPTPRATTSSSPPGATPRPRAPDPGRRLLAHELAHVVQQSAGAGTEPRVSAPGDAGERAADRAARAVSTGGAAGDVRTAGPVAAVQRQPAGAEPERDLRPSLWFLMSMGRLTIAGFPLGRATLGETDVSMLKGHAAVLKGLLATDPGGRVMVTGHTDATGTAERNTALGLERAAAVRAELMAGGLAGSLIGIESAGSGQPAVPSKGEEPANRRAVVAYLPAPRIPGMGAPGAGLPGTFSPGAAPPPPGPSAPRTDGWPKGPVLEPWKPNCALYPALCGQATGPIRPEADKGPAGLWKEPPPPPRTRPALERFFDDQPLLRLLPPELRKKAVDGLVKGTDKVPGAIVDKVEGLDPQTADLLKAVLTALWKYMNGQKWEPPPPPPERAPPPSTYSFPRMPGEVLPTIPIYSW